VTLPPDIPRVPPTAMRTVILLAVSSVITLILDRAQ